MGFWIALQFLTVFPVPGRFVAKMAHIGESIVYFPIVGLFLGIILALLSWALNFILPLQVTSIIIVIALAALTGAHHLDGLADTYDGMVAGKTVPERMAIMSDVKTGTFGIAAVTLVLLFKYSVLSADNVMLMQTLILMPVVSRWSMTCLLFMFPSAKKTGMGFSYKQGTTANRFIIATVITIVIAVVLSGWKGVVVLAAIWLISFCIGARVRSRIGGITGDTCGAVNEINEAMVPLFIIIMAAAERICCG
jgi:adenosylcobinamide-GDP ribazoletransferase